MIRSTKLNAIQLFYEMGSATHISNKTWVMERWVRLKDGIDKEKKFQSFQIG
jgi:hypothetical protein